MTLSSCMRLTAFLLVAGIAAPSQATTTHDYSGTCEGPFFKFDFYNRCLRAFWSIGAQTSTPLGGSFLEHKADEFPQNTGTDIAVTLGVSIADLVELYGSFYHVDIATGRTGFEPTTRGYSSRWSVFGVGLRWNYLRLGQFRSFVGLEYLDGTEHRLVDEYRSPEKDGVREGYLLYLQNPTSGGALNTGAAFNVFPWDVARLELGIELRLERLSVGSGEASFTYRHEGKYGTTYSYQPYENVEYNEIQHGEEWEEQGHPGGVLWRFGAHFFANFVF